MRRLVGIVFVSTLSLAACDLFGPEEGTAPPSTDPLRIGHAYLGGGPFMLEVNGDTAALDFSIGDAVDLEVATGTTTVVLESAQGDRFTFEVPMVTPFYEGLSLLVITGTGPEPDVTRLSRAEVPGAAVELKVVNGIPASEQTIWVRISGLATSLGPYTHTTPVRIGLDEGTHAVQAELGPDPDNPDEVIDLGAVAMASGPRWLVAVPDTSGTRPAGALAF